jgi:hypothetical protein
MPWGPLASGMVSRELLLVGMAYTLGPLADGLV